jgi:hypothetical protein
MGFRILRTGFSLAAVVALLDGRIGVVGQSVPGVPRLSGIVSLGDVKLAVVETAGGGPSDRRDSYILSEGQREGQFEVEAILPAIRTVKLNLYAAGSRSTLLLTNDAADASVRAPGLLFQNASLEPVLRLYAQFSARTLLRWPQLPNRSTTLVSPASNRAAAAAALKKVLEQEGISSISDGEKFLMIVPSARASFVKPRSNQIKPEPAQSEILPPGTINFPGTDVNQVLQIYAELVNRKLAADGSRPLPGQVIQFRNDIPLTRAEVAYALETLLEWRGVKIVAAEDNRIKAVLVTNSNR